MIIFVESRVSTRAAIEKVMTGKHYNSVVLVH